MIISVYISFKTYKTRKNQLLVDQRKKKLCEEIEASINIWTKIADKLVSQGYIQFADIYKKYYEVGWKLCESDFPSSILYREIISMAWKILAEAVVLIKKMRQY